MGIKIRTKIGVVFIVLLTVILAIGSLYYLVAEQYELHLHQVNEDMEELHLIRGLQLALVQAIMPVNDFLIAGSHSNEPEEFKALSAKVENLIEELDKLEFDRSEKRELLNHVKGDYQQLKGMALQIFSIHNSVGNIEAGQLMEEMDKLIDDAAADLDEFRLFSHQATEETQTGWQRTKYLLNLKLYSGILFSIFLIIGALVFFTRAVSSPITSLKDAALEFAQGNLEKQVKITTNDEIGYLAKAFNKMVAELRISFTALDNEIANRKLAEEKIRDSEERFRSVAGTANDAIISIDSNGEIIFWNNAAKNIFGYSVDEAIGKMVALVMPKQFHEVHRKGMERVIKTGESILIGKTIELTGLRKDGSEFPVEVSISTWKVKDRVYFTAIIRDITERKKTEEEISRLATTDTLTTAYNRLKFKEIILNEMERNKRYSLP